jgi:redox-regulated HSP33 family molecular chaperone
MNNGMDYESSELFTHFANSLSHQAHLIKTIKAIAQSNMRASDVIYSILALHSEENLKLLESKFTKEGASHESNA